MTADPQRRRRAEDRARSMIVEERPYREFLDGRLRVYGYSYDPQAVAQITTVAGHGWWPRPR